MVIRCRGGGMGMPPHLSLPSCDSIVDGHAGHAAKRTLAESQRFVSERMSNAIRDSSKSRVGLF